MFASLEVCTTSRSALADLLARMYFWTRPSLSRSLVGRHPCWTTACFLPCTRPPDIPRLRLRRPTRRPGPSERDARLAFTLTLLLPRAADPEGTSSFCFFLCFLVMLSILWCTFSSLCLCDLSILCLHIHSLCVYAIT